MVVVGHLSLSMRVSLTWEVVVVVVLVTIGLEIVAPLTLPPLFVLGAVEGLALGCKLALGL